MAHNVQTHSDWAFATSSRTLLQRVPLCYLCALSAVLDFLLIVASSIVGEISYSGITFGGVGDIPASVGVGTNAGLVFVLLMSSRQHYRPPALLSPIRQLRAVAVDWTTVLLVLAGVFFLLKIGANYSRGSLLCFGFFGFASLSCSHIWIAVYARDGLAKDLGTGRRAVLVGSRRELERFSSRDLLGDYAAREIGRFVLSDNDENSWFEDLPLVETAARAAQVKEAEMVLIALPWSDERRRNLICDMLRMLPIPILLLPDRNSEELLIRPLQQMGLRTAIEMGRAPFSIAELVVKRSFDVLLAGLGLLVLAPLLGVVSAMIALESPGPIIFRQRRKGFNGRTFTIYKFRTMTVTEDGTELRQAMRDDPRVTRVGRFLRRTSIDELPQLINVLRGHMSFVGPRPHAIVHDDEYSTRIADYALRRRVKPGLTGWAQVNGFRGETAKIELMKKRIEHDIWYTNNWSVWLDISIIARTFRAVTSGGNAY